MMKQLTGILLTIILLCGCDNEINKSDVVLGKKSEVYLNSFVDSATILPLKMEDDFFLGDINKINYIDSSFIILDKKTNAVFAFNELGQSLGYLHNQGQGPQEYISIYDFDIDRDNDKIYLLCNPKMIMITDLKFNVDSIIRLHDYYERIAVDSGNVYLYSHLDRSLNLLDHKSENVRKILVEESMPQIYMGSELVFHHVDGDLLYIAAGSDIVYQVENDNPVKLFMFDYETKKATEELMNKKEPLSTRELLSYSPPRIHSISKINENYNLIYTYQSLVRDCVISRDLKILEDGLLISKGNIPVSMTDDYLIAWDYFNDNRLPIDTTAIKVSYLSPLSEKEDMAIVKYVLKK